MREMKFSEKLQKLRKEKKLSQEQLAEMLEVSRQSVSKWESGLTYPEMDKLIALCKIFNCTLDDLTNDEVSDIVIKQKQQTNLTNMIDELLNLINRSYCMFQSLSGQQIGKMIVELLLLVFVLFLVKIPFNWIARSLGSIFNDIYVIRQIIYFIFDIGHLILSIIIFFYIYNMRYLSEFEKGHLEEVTEESIEAEEVNMTENQEATQSFKEKKIRKHTGLNKFIACLGEIFMWGVKGFAILFGIPFIMMIIIAIACFIITLYMAFKGVFFFSIMFGLLSFMIVNYEVIEIIYVFVCNKIYDWKRLFFMFITALVLLGCSFGSGFIELSQFSFHNEISPQIECDTYQRVIKMEEDLTWQSGYHWAIGEVERVIDNEMKDTLEFIVTYPKENVQVNILKEENKLYLECETKVINFSTISQDILADLKNKEFYSYNYDQVKMIVEGSEENLKKLEKNTQTYLEQINEAENSMDQEREYYENELANYQSEIERLQLVVDEQALQLEDYQSRLSQLQEIIGQ